MYSVVTLLNAKMGHRLDAVIASQVYVTKYYITMIALSSVSLFVQLKIRGQKHLFL